MRKFNTLLLSIFLSVTAFAQSADQPPSFSESYLPTPEKIELSTPDLNALFAEAEKFEREEGRTMNGKIIYQDLNPEQHGTWSTLADGSSMWRLHLRAEEAMSVSVYFSSFHLPVGSSLWIYNADKTYFEGPIDHSENNDHGLFVTNDMWGEDIILEYHQPVSVIGDPQLEINGLGYFFRYVYPPYELVAERGGSQPCEVDVNCPEGEHWQFQRDAVVRMRITDSGATFLCSGVMVNTTAMDCRQYLLSALHCADGVSDSDLLLLQVRFNYERPWADIDDDGFPEWEECGTGGFSSAHNRTGVFRLADSNDNGGGGFSGSDFLLLEVEDEIQEAWTPYFAGWDATGAGSATGVGIHHPAGDIKKISTYTSSLQSVWLGAPGSHWEVEWVETVTDHGVTEGGSSGSPIFNSDKLIVGTLSAGLSACENGGAGNGTGPNEPDYYGKMNYHWSNNPNTDDQKLREWLDPIGAESGNYTEVVFGSYKNDDGLCDPSVSVEEQAQPDEIVISPNPTTGQIMVRVVSMLQAQSIVIYDMTGKEVLNEQLNGPVTTYDLSFLPAGSYYASVMVGQKRGTTQKIVKY